MFEYANKKISSHFDGDVIAVEAPDIKSLLTMNLMMWQHFFVHSSCFNVTAFWVFATI